MSDDRGYCPEPSCRRLILKLPSGLLAQHRPPADPVLAGYGLTRSRWCKGSGELPGVPPTRPFRPSTPWQRRATESMKGESCG